MKAITLEGLRDCLLYDRHVITVPEDIRTRAKAAIDRMVSIG